MRIATLAAFAALAFTVPAQADCLSDIKDILNRSMASGPYAMSVDSPEMKMTSNVVPPGGFHSTIETGGLKQEMIVLDGKAWSNMAGQGWTAMPEAVAAQITATVALVSTMAGRPVRPRPSIATTRRSPSARRRCESGLLGPVLSPAPL